MTADLESYPAMKESGVPWLGEVPEHWQVRSVGGMGSLFKGNGGNKGDEVPAGIPCVRYGDLYTRHEFFITKSKACVSKERAGQYTPIHYGDVLFAASGETMEDIGRSSVNLIEGEARCGGDVLVLRPEVPTVPRYLGYAADSSASRNQKACMGRGFTVVHIYGSQLKRLLLPLPPLPEQAAIVRFLDHADRRIRRYIRTKQKLIKLLEEQKQAIIHRAVTRGLDPNVRLKPSGVEWLRDVPEHWEVLPIKRAFVSMVYGVSESATNEGSVRLLTMGNIRDGTVTVPTDGGVTTVDPSMLIEENDLLFNRTNSAELVGKVGLFRGAPTPVTFASYLVRMRPRSDADPEFLNLLLNDHSVLSVVRREAIPSLHQANLNPTRYGRLHIALPQKDEQEEIVRFVSTATASVRTAIEGAHREVDLLREYRTRLIADVVTGKLDVREAAAQLPDEVDEPEPLDESNVWVGAGDATADGLVTELQEADA